MFYCSYCERDLPPENFYLDSNHTRKHRWCKVCNSKSTVIRQQKFKQQCVDYKGGKCELCGYNKCLAALEFHHLDPSKKDFQISKIRLVSFDKYYNKIVTELDKCQLLCSNCHKEIHSTSGRT